MHVDVALERQQEGPVVADDPHVRGSATSVPTPAGVIKRGLRQAGEGVSVLAPHDTGASRTMCASGSGRSSGAGLVAATLHTLAMDHVGADQVVEFRLEHLVWHLTADVAIHYLGTVRLSTNNAEGHVGVG